jgi:hypothetical protein
MGKVGGKLGIRYHNTVKQAWWHAPVIPALRRPRQKNYKFQASLGYTARPCLKQTSKIKQKPHLKQATKQQTKKCS